MVFFLAIFTSVYLGMHWYVYSRVAGPLHVSHAASLYMRLFFLFFALSFIAGQFLSKSFPSALTTTISFASSVWMGLMAISLTVFIANDLLKLVFKSEAFSYRSCIVSLIVIVILSVYSVINASGKPVVKEIDISSAKIPKEFDGYRVVQLTDLHIDHSRSNAWLQNIIEETNALNPDLILITGDLIDSDLCTMDNFCLTLAGLKAKNGVYAISGNHEFYTGIPLFLKICSESNITVLRNSHTTVAGFMELAGIDDQESVKRFHLEDNDIAKAMEGVDRKKFVLFMSHQPDVFLQTKDFVDLQLSGHTHNGQIPPMDIMVQFYFKYPCGLYKEGNSYQYTSPGTGTWGPPMRLSSKNEITLITLKRPS
jgi:predicted MPP superfamily phosphohydrolase